MEGDDVPISEVRGVHMENIMRAEQGMELRTHYGTYNKALVANGIETTFGYDYKNNPNVERNYGRSIKLTKSPYLKPKGISVPIKTPTLQLKK